MELDLPAAGNAPSGLRAGLLIKLGRAYGAAGWLQQGCNALDEALRLLPAGSSAQRAETASVWGRLQRQLGRADQASATIRAELEAAAFRGATDSFPGATDRAFLSIEAAPAESPEGWSEKSYSHAAMALAAAGPNNPALRVSASGLVTIANCFAGSISAAEEELRYAVSVIDGLSDSELAESPDAAMWTGWAEFFLEKQRSALRHFDRAVDLGRTTGQYLVVYHATVGQVLILTATGRLAAAAARSDDAIAVAATLARGELRTNALALRCLVAARTGDLDLLRRQCPAGVSPVADGWFSALTLGMLAEARMAIGDSEGCLGLLGAPAGPGLSALCPSSRVGRYELLTRAALHVGCPDAADGWALLAEELADELALAGCRGLALLARAHVLACRDPAAGASTALAAAEALTSAGMILDAARARVVAAAGLVASGEAAQAQVVAAEAQRAYRECGAEPIAQQVAAEWQRLAGRVTVSRRRARTGVGSLTNRELQAAELVSHGLTNRQIAVRLFVTEKTVEMHLSNTFAKLGVRNRVGVAGEFHRYSECSNSDLAQA